MRIFRVTVRVSEGEVGMTDGEVKTYAIRSGNFYLVVDALW